MGSAPGGRFVHDHELRVAEERRRRLSAAHAAVAAADFLPTYVPKVRLPEECPDRFQAAGTGAEERQLFPNGLCT